MTWIVSASLLIVGLIHLLPAVGVLGGDRLAGLYGMTLDDPNLLVLMRHRAVLFGVLGVFLIVAAFRPTWQMAGLLAGLVSVVAYLWLVAATGGVNAQLTRVFQVDLVALVVLIVGLGARLWVVWRAAG